MVGFAVVVVGVVKLVGAEPGRGGVESKIATADLAKWCGDTFRSGFPDAARYQGQGPHPMVIVGFNDDLEKVDRKLPAAWRAQRVQVQLIGCDDGSTIGETVLGQSCHFDVPKARDVPIVRTTSQLSLYEARSGRPVGEVSVPSGTGAVCPSQLTAYDGVVVEAEPGYEEYAEALKQYVEK